MSNPNAARLAPEAHAGTGGGASAAASGAAPVLEVFASIQGEGLYVGEPQVFLRLRGCPLRCRYCDTPGSWVVGPDDRARIDPLGAAAPRREAQWATPFQAACWIASAEGATRRTVSLTGGEPLLWPGFVEHLAEFAAPRRVHLETAGAHPAALARVLARVHHVSLDLKLAADLERPVPLPAELGATAEPVPRDAAEWSAARRASLALVAGRDACAKLVLGGGRPALEYAPLLDELAELAPDVPLFVQPATPMGGVRAPARAELESLVEAALARELSVRVVPQVHRTLRLP